MSIADRLATIAENEKKVYDAGYEKGNQAGYTEGYNQGEEDIRTFIWDAIQIEDYDYSYAFAGMYWKKSLFKPRKNIKPTIANRMFAAFDYRKREEPLDLVEDLKTLGITLDFSKCKGMAECFGSANITRLGIVDMKSHTAKQYGIFSCEFMKTIDKLILYEHNVYSSWFNASKLLENLTIEGVIGQNGFSVGNSPLLTKASIISIINALSDTTTALTVTLSKTAVDKAFETSPQASDGSQSAEWTALEGTKSNWTISLV